MDKAEKSLPYGNKGNLLEGEIRRHLVRLSVPMIWGILAIISFQVVDLYFISLLGTQQLAAISFTFPVTMAVFYLVMGLAIATSSVVSRLIGQNAREDVARVATHAVLLAFVLGIALAAIGLAAIDPLFRAMGAGESMLPMIRDYMTIWYAGCVFVTTPMVGNAAIRATGDTRFPALVMCAAAAINIVLDPLLIFGLAGFPRMEIQGAALATMIANAGAMAAGLYVLHFRKKLVAVGRVHLEKLGDSLRRLLVIALPAGLTNIMAPVAQAVLIALLAQEGHEAVAAFGVVTRVESFAMVILMAVAVGMAPIIGQNWGAGRFDRVHRTLRLALGFSALWSLGVALALGLFARPVAGLFSAEPGVIDLAALYFLIVPLSYIPGNLVNGWASAFNAMGLPRRAFVMIAVRMLILQIPLAVAGHALHGAAGVFAAVALTNILAGGVFHVLNLRACARREHEREHPEDRAADALQPGR